MNKKEVQMMKISTAEIKILIKECIKTGGVFTAENFGNYITQLSQQIFPNKA